MTHIVAPTTTATTSPVPDSTGWNNDDVTVILNATDNNGGVGVREVSYSATGAQTIESTSVNGASNWFSITTSGTTSVTFYATDNAGNVEATKTITVKVNKQLTLMPIADTYVKGANSYRDMNYGADAEMQTKRPYEAGSGRGRRSFLKFDLSDMNGSVVSARLRIYAQLSDASLANVPMRVQRVADTSWLEGDGTLGSGITWNTQPGVASPDALATDIIVVSNTPQWYEFDLTPFVQAEVAAGWYVVSVRLINMVLTGNSGAYYTTIATKEAGIDFAPRLILAQ